MWPRRSDPLTRHWASGAGSWSGTRAPRWSAGSWWKAQQSKPRKEARKALRSPFARRWLNRRLGSRMPPYCVALNPGRGLLLSPHHLLRRLRPSLRVLRKGGAHSEKAMPAHRATRAAGTAGGNFLRGMGTQEKPPALLPVWESLALWNRIFPSENFLFSHRVASMRVWGLFFRGYLIAGLQGIISINRGRRTGRSWFASRGRGLF